MINELLKYYRKAAGYPLLFSLIAGIILALTHDGSGYKSEWFADDGFGLTISMSIGLSLFISFLSLTLLLNRFTFINSNIFYSFIIWVLPAGLVCLYVIWLELDNFMTKEYYEGNRLVDGYIMSLAIVHLAFLVGTFLMFRKRVQLYG